MADKSELVSVWITEHDLEEVGYVVNERSDMRENWRDLREAGIDGGMTFDEYLSSWVEMEMPKEILNDEDPMVRINWIENELEILR